MRHSTFRKMTRQAGVVIPLSAIAIYLLVFLILPPQSRNLAPIISVLPVIAVGWTFGLRAALLMVVFTIPLNTALMNAAGRPGWDALIRSKGGVLGTIALIGAGAAVGRLRDLWGRLEKEVSDRKLLETELVRHRDHLEELVTERSEDLSRGNEKLQREVDQRGRAERQLTASEGRITRFLNALPMGVVVFGADTELQYMNEHARNLYGLRQTAEPPMNPDQARTLEEMRAELPIYKAGEQEPYPRDQSPVLRALSGERVRVDDIELELREQRLPMEVLSVPIRDDKGQVEFALLAFQDISDRVRLEGRLDSIYKLGGDLALMRDEQAIGRRVIEEAHLLLDFELAGFALADEASSELVCQYTIIDVDEKGSTLRLPLAGKWPRSIRAQVYRTGKSINVPDVTNEPLYYRETPGWDGRSELCVPIRVGDRILGVLNAESRQLNRFSQDDEKLLQALADQCGIAVENTRMYSQLQQHQEELEELVMERTAKLSEASERLATLNDASHALGVASTDAEQVYGAIHQAVSWLMSAEVFCITLVDHERAEAEDVFTVGVENQRNAEPYPVAETFVDYMFRRGKSLRIDDVRLISEEANPVVAHLEADTRAVLAVLLSGSNRNMGVMMAQCKGSASYSEEDVKILEMLAAHAATAIENVQLYQVAQRAAADEERQRLSRHLHDSVAQSLYSLTLMTNGWAAMSVKGELENPAQSFRQLEQLGVQALGEMRLLIHQLRPPILEETGLVGALRERLEAVEHRMGLETQLVTEGDVERLPQQMEEELFHISQEALNNALRHAEASNIWVRIAVHNGSARLVIEDDGRGFDIGNGNGGLGLTSMRERAEGVGGKFLLATGSGKGTVVEVLLELSEVRKE